MWVHAFAEQKAIGRHEAHEVSLQGPFRTRLIHQHGAGHGSGALSLAEGMKRLKGDALIENVVDQQHVPAPEAIGSEASSRAAPPTLGFVAVASHLKVVQLKGKAQVSQEIGGEAKSADHHAQDERVQMLVDVRNGAGAALHGAVEQRRGRKEALGMIQHLKIFLLQLTLPGHENAILRVWRGLGFGLAWIGPVQPGEAYGWGRQSRRHGAQ